jgi:hypothetical protein
MENHYEGNLEEHLNLVCECCGKILDYELPRVADQHEIAKKPAFRSPMPGWAIMGVAGAAIKK